ELRGQQRHSSEEKDGSIGLEKVPRFAAAAGAGRQAERGSVLSTRPTQRGVAVPARTQKSSRWLHPRATLEVEGGARSPERRHVRRVPGWHGQRRGVHYNGVRAPAV